MQLGVPKAADPALARRLLGLTALRLSVLGAALLLPVRQLPSGGYSSRVAFATVAIAFALALLYAVFLRAGAALPFVAYAQLVTDQITWTALVYLTGGATSGAAALYGLTSMTGAILLGLQGALVAAFAGAASFTALCALLVGKQLLPPPDQPADLYATSWKDLQSPLYLVLLAIAVVTLLAAYLAERLRTTGGRLEEATQRALDAERLAGLGRLAAGLAHEIRNPLGAIAGSIELLRTGGTLGAEDVELCDLMARETSRLDELVTDMLDLSRPRTPNKERIDVAALARDVVDLAQKSGRAGDVSVRLEAEAPAIVDADGAQLRQVIWNLLRNATQASSAGQEVVVRVSQEGAAVRLEIVDAGPGIPEDAKARLFDAFFTTRSKGAGIGLAVVKRIVDDHGFAIEVESVPGQGTTFRVRAPAA